MPTPRRIAVLKPDHGVTGGFESVVARIEDILRADGHEVTRLSVDMVPTRRSVAGLDIPAEVWAAAPEYFPYLAARDAFDRLDTRRYDAVLSTQPPSFSHRHRRHLAVFYHHHRVYYDLLDPYIAAGFAADPDAHREAAKLIAELDQPRLDAVGWFLAGSAAVAERLGSFNGIDRASLFHAGRIVGAPTGDTSTGVTRDTADDPPGTGAVLCVGRHEWPKRTELVVAAAHLAPSRPFTIVGTGGREAWARALDIRLANGELAPEALTDEDLWSNTGRGAPQVTGEGLVRFAGRVDDATLARAFHDAPCVIAPAFAEDYGLTAVEAMAQGRPVIVCHDGGGLVELVEHRKTGLVVDPTPAAIAAAVEMLAGDPDLASELGANGRRRAAEISWEAAADELRDGLERVLA